MRRLRGQREKRAPRPLSHQHLQHRQQQQQQQGRRAQRPAPAGKAGGAGAAAAGGGGGGWQARSANERAAREQGSEEVGEQARLVGLLFCCLLAWRGLAWREWLACLPCPGGSAGGRTSSPVVRFALLCVGLSVCLPSVCAWFCVSRFRVSDSSPALSLPPPSPYPALSFCLSVRRAGCLSGEHRRRVDSSNSSVPMPREPASLVQLMQCDECREGLVSCDSCWEGGDSVFAI